MHFEGGERGEGHTEMGRGTYGDGDCGNGKWRMENEELRGDFPTPSKL